MSDKYVIIMIAVIAAVTMVLRFVPFIIFAGKRETPKYIAYLGTVLPFSIMGMLVVYCLRNISFTKSPFGLPELVSGTAVVLLHLWKRNTLLSIIGGTICYMLLVQVVF